MNNLKPLKSSLGQPAEGESKYFPRDKIVKKILRKLDAGENILISAPRRIGKSSILKHIARIKNDNQIIKYMIVQSVNSQEEFFKKLFNELIEDKEIFEGLQSYFKRATSTLRSYVSRVSGISLDGITINPDEVINYYEECINLIKSFKTDKKIIIFIDEFPDALNNILDKDESLAINFLQQNRDIREKFSDNNLQFVYTGSTGLKNVVRKFKKLDLINDINTIEVLPFTDDEAQELINRLVLGYQEEIAEFKIDENTVGYILEKISWKLPYYMQIIIDELFEHYEESEEDITNDTVDFILDKIVKSKSTHSDYFENWKDRLGRAFKNEDYGFAIEVLNFIAKNESIDYAEFCDLATKNEVQDHKYVLDVLEHDGYISEDDKRYGFNSVLLKNWWFINVAI
jgi:energy-coupling factor transporter ATP-binding protein EcfA2